MKEYVKPMVYFEDFTLAQHIAACDIKVNSIQQHECDPGKSQGPIDLDPLNPGFSTVFWKSVGCEFKPGDNQVVDFCYMNSVAGTTTTFAS